MDKNLILKHVAKIGEKSAQESSRIWCPVWLYQPKVPAALINKKDK